MEGWELEQSLSTMTIIIDTREQTSKRAERRYSDFSVPYIRQKLDYGDYSAYCTDVYGNKHIAKAVIERKMNLEELSGCLAQQRDRFEREFERAKANGSRIYLLVENATWENLINGKYKTKFNSKAFFGSLIAWIARYQIRPIFCKSETSGKLIQEILYRELKEELKNG